MEYPEKTTDLSQVTDKIHSYPSLLYNCLYKAKYGCESISYHTYMSRMFAVILERDTYEIDRNIPEIKIEKLTF
jgi:hypothetical protein